MSRIGKQPVVIPSGVSVEIGEATIRVQGALGTLDQAFQRGLTVRVDDGQVLVERKNDSRAQRAFHGLTRSLIANMVHGRQASIVISDLHRHWLAYWSIRLLTALFSRSAAVGHDGPLSVRKGFRKSDLEDILAAANIRQAWIRWRWAFRWVVVIEAREVGATTA